MHSYQEKVCLLQFSWEDETALVDPLAGADMKALRAPFSNPDIRKIFHAADYDIRCLARDFDMQICGLFDTMIASQLLGEPKVGLADVLRKYFGLELDKKYQRADWSKRPLDANMLHYAAEDTRHLEALHLILRRSLEEKNRLWWAEEEFLLLEQVRFSPPAGPACLQVKGASALKPRQLEVLEQLLAWRDAQARSRDCPAYKVLGTKPLLAIAAAMPHTLGALEAIDEFPAKLRQRYARAILECVEVARTRPEHELPVVPVRRRREFDPGVEERLRTLKKWRAGKARELELDPGVLINNQTLIQIARMEAQTLDDLGAVAGMRAWQRRVLGQDIIQALIP